MSYPVSILVVLFLCAPAFAENMVFPPDSGVVDLTQAPYNAKGDGQTDCTEAIQKALNELNCQNKILWLPNGTYLVSNTLKWGGTTAGNNQKRTILQGQSEAGVIIRLKDACAGFDNPAKPKPVIWTGTLPAQRFRNAVRNLTVDVGKGNAGANGMHFYANNQGAVRNVTIRTSDAGHIGLDLAMGDQGPCLIKDLKVAGFETGIFTKNGTASITFANITLEGQKKVGFLNQGQCVFVENLVSRNALTALSSPDKSSVVYLVNAELTGTNGAGEVSALENGAFFFARNVKTTGYKHAMESKPEKAEAATVDGKIEEFSSHPVKTLFPNNGKSLAISIQPTPDVPWDDLKDWVSPLVFGGKPDDDGDDTEAIQKALDAGKPTVYLPNGAWKLSGDLRIRGVVRRFIGCEARFKGEGRILIEDGEPPVVAFERIEMNYTKILVEVNTARTVVFANTTLALGLKARGATLFFDDVCGYPFEFVKCKVWARQLNPEGSEGPRVLNDGGTVWILGMKTEGDATAVHNRNGAMAEVAAFYYANTGRPKKPLYIIEEGCGLSTTFGQAAFRKEPFKQLAIQTQKGETKTLTQDGLSGRAGGAAMALFVAKP